MGLKAIFCVQPFWFDGGQLRAGYPEQYATAGEAKRAAERLYLNHAGVSLYEVRGNPEYDSWSDPREIWSVGRTLGAPVGG